MNATLVAPLEGDHDNTNKTRSVWIPPGDWQDGWTGKMVTGPKTIQFEATESEGVFNIPMWHKPGSVVVTVEDGRQRIDDQDWAELTIEAFPSAKPASERREIAEQEHSPAAAGAAFKSSDGTGSNTMLITAVELETDGTGAVQISVSPNAVGVERAWVVRVHLLPNHRLELQTSDADANNGDVAAAAASLKHIQPRRCDADGADFPFAGAGHAPPCLAGAIAEFRLPPSSNQRLVHAWMVKV